MEKITHQHLDDDEIVIDFWELFTSSNGESGGYYWRPFLEPERQGHIATIF